jgi:hypothetical protein
LIVASLFRHALQEKKDRRLQPGPQASYEMGDHGALDDIRLNGAIGHLLGCGHPSANANRCDARTLRAATKKTSQFEAAVALASQLPDLSDASHDRNHGWRPTTARP